MIIFVIISETELRRIHGTLAGSDTKTAGRKLHIDRALKDKYNLKLTM
jgi:hypothetical protein